MKPIAPGTVIFHRYRGYGVLTAVNLLTGWVSARFGNEQRCLDLNLSTDEVQHADGEPILFRLSPPDRMPHGRLMEMVLKLHSRISASLSLFMAQGCRNALEMASVYRLQDMAAKALERGLVRFRCRLYIQSCDGLG